MKAISASVLLVMMILISPSEVFALVCLLILAIIGMCAFAVALGNYEVNDD